MKYVTHSIGKFGSGYVDVLTKELMIICNDTDSINRVFKGSNCNKLTPFGRGWTLNIPKSKQGEMSFENGKLTRFTDVRGVSYGFFYYSGFLRGISTPDGMISYDYNGDGMLTRVTYPDGSCVHISYRDIFYMHDICICDDKNAGVLAVSYADQHYANGVGCVYEYNFCGSERVEKKFTDLSDAGKIITLQNNKKQALTTR